MATKKNETPGTFVPKSTNFAEQHMEADLARGGKPAARVKQIMGATKKKSTTVTVLLYSHRHGVDCSAYKTKERAIERAIEGAAGIVMDNLDDIRDDKVLRKLKRLYGDKKYEALINVWSGYHQNRLFDSEDFEFYETEVIE